MNIGEKIKAVMKQSGFNQKELASTIGVSQATIGKIINNATKFTSVNIAIKISKALDRNVVELFSDEDFTIYSEDNNNLKKEIESLKNQLADKTLIIELLLNERKQANEPTH